MQQTPGWRLTAVEVAAVWQLLDRVRDEVEADLVEASLFGSRARGDARSDSDLDLLLVFDALPPDREPHAGLTDRIAEQVARDTRVPVAAWTVSLIDFREGNRTPMLVDASCDAIPFWSRSEGRIGPVPLTPADAVRCVTALLDRVAEGGTEFARAVEAGDFGRAARRGRDDLVRLCTAALLLQGQTRPRRADAIRRYARTAELQRRVSGRILGWGVASFGPDGTSEDETVRPPADGFEALADAVHDLRLHVVSELEAFLDRMDRASAPERTLLAGWG